MLVAPYSERTGFRWNYASAFMVNKLFWVFGPPGLLIIGASTLLGGLDLQWLEFMVFLVGGFFWCMGVLVATVGLVCFFARSKKYFKDRKVPWTLFCVSPVLSVLFSIIAWITFWPH